MAKTKSHHFIFLLLASWCREPSDRTSALYTENIRFHLHHNHLKKSDTNRDVKDLYLRHLRAAPVKVHNTDLNRQMVCLSIKHLHMFMWPTSCIHCIPFNVIVSRSNSSCFVCELKLSFFWKMLHKFREEKLFFFLSISNMFCKHDQYLYLNWWVVSCCMPKGYVNSMKSWCQENETEQLPERSCINREQRMCLE